MDSNFTVSVPATTFEYGACFLTMWLSRVRCRGFAKLAKGFIYAMNTNYLCPHIARAIWGARGKANFNL